MKPEHPSSATAHRTLISVATAPPIGPRQPVSRLPWEILIHIFLYLSSIQTSNPSWPSVSRVLGQARPRSLRLGWIVVTHVCREWRGAALRAHELWRNVSFSLGSRWAKCMFSRSGNRLLTVRAHIGRPLQSLEDALRISQHLPRIEDLRLSASADRLPTFLKRLQGKAPVLQTLSLTAEIYGEDVDKHNIPIPVFDLPSCDAPVLLHLSIHNVFVQFRPHSIFYNLKTLSLVLPFLGRYHPQTIYSAGFMDTIACMPNVEALTLHGLLPQAVSLHHGTPETVHKVSLPFLVRLDLGGEVDNITFTLMHLDLPLVAQAEIRLTGYLSYDWGVPRSIPILFRALARMIVPAGDETLPIRDLHLSQPCSTYLRFKGAVLQSDDETTLLDIKLDVLMGAHDKYDRSPRLSMLRKAFAGIQPRRLLSLEVDRMVIPREDMGQWSKLLWDSRRAKKHQPVINAVTLDGITFGHFSSFLSMRSAHTITKANAALPYLKLLRLRNLALSEPMRQNMLQWLRARKACNLALRTLVFYQCPADTVHDSWVDELREVMAEGDNEGTVVVESPM